MIRYPAYYILMAAFFLPVFAQDAGYVLEEEWTTPPMFGMPGNTRKVRTWIASNKIRRDEADSSQIIFVRPDVGKMWLLRPKEKTYLELDRETLQGLSMMALMVFGIGMNPETGKPSIPDSMFIKTGRRMQIESWNCHEVLIRRQQGRVVALWMSDETGLERGLYGKILKSMMGEYASSYQSFFQQLDALEGYPVLIEAIRGGKGLAQKLIAVRKEIISDSVFQIPRGYKKTEWTEK